jgi:hypothetical protein
VVKAVIVVRKWLLVVEGRRRVRQGVREKQEDLFGDSLGCVRRE